MEKFIFDIDGTLLKIDWKYEEDYFNSVLSVDDANKFIPMISELLADYERKFLRYDIDKLGYFLTVSTGVNITSEIVRGWIEAGKNYYEVIPGACDVLEYLKSNDKKIVALSNWFSSMNATRLKNASLYEYFDQVFCSDLVDMKPNPSSYITVCGETSFSDTVMIGDSLELDVLAPSELGINALYFCPNEKMIIDKPKVKVIRKLQDIKEMY